MDELRAALDEGWTLEEAGKQAIELHAGMSFNGRKIFVKYISYLSSAAA